MQRLVGLISLLYIQVVVVPVFQLFMYQVTCRKDTKYHKTVDCAEGGFLTRTILSVFLLLSAIIITRIVSDYVHNSNPFSQSYFSMPKRINYIDYIVCPFATVALFASDL